MNRTLSILLNEALAREAARAYVFSHLDWKFVGCLTLLLVYCGYALFANQFGFLAGGAFVVLSFAFGAFFLGLRHVTSRELDTLRRRSGEPATLEFGESGLRLSSPRGDIKFDWSETEALKRYKSVSLLLFKGGGYVTIPNQCAEESDFSRMLSFIDRGKKVNA